MSEANENNDPNSNPSSEYRVQGGASSQQTEPGTSDDLRDYFHKGVLILLLFVGLVAALQFYMSTTTAIDLWVADKYTPIFQAGFNLAILILVVVGIIREMEKVEL